MNIHIREMNENDPNIISSSFKEQGWKKPVSLYHRYLEEQRKGDRISIIAEVDGVFAGFNQVSPSRNWFKING
jgi:hypothetical protein